MAEYIDNTHGNQHQSFVRVHKGLPLATVIDMIQRSDDDFTQHMVHVFHEVVPELTPFGVSRAWDQLLTSGNVPFICQELRRTSIDGFYFNDKSGGYSVGTPTELRNLLVSYAPNNGLPLTMAQSNAFIEETLTSVAESRVSPICSMKFQQRPAIPCSLLSDVPFHVSVERNPRVDRRVGVNIPTFSLAGRHSFKEMHVKDGFLDSCDLMHWGSPGACKLWTFIDPRYSWPLNKVAYGSKELIRERGENCSLLLPYCQVPIHHNKMVVSPSFLTANGIQFTTVVQPPRSLVYVRDGIYHQIVSTGMNLSESVCVGSNIWNASSHIFITCGCPDTAIAYITGTRSSKLQPSEFAASSDLDNASAEGDQGTNVCSLCRRSFSSPVALARHKKTVHSLRDTDNIMCERCRLPLKARSYSKHLQTCAPSGVTCKWCGKAYARRGIGNHERHCSQRPKTSK